MAYASTTTWEIHPAGGALRAAAPRGPIFANGGSDTANGGSFDPGNPNMATDLVATSALTIAPVVTSASYTFIARDVGHWVFIKSGTNWIPGWYQIASVAGGAATLLASVGNAVLYNSPAIGFGPSITAGCATTASSTGGTWSIDYSQYVVVPFTDMVIGGTTTQFTSALKPVGKNFVGNMIIVTSGTNFTLQRVQIVSTSGTTATCDRSLGTAGATGGNGGLGGPMSSLSTATAANVGDVAGMQFFVKSGTYTEGQINIYNQQCVEGFGTIRGDLSLTGRPVLQHGPGPTYLVLTQSAYKSQVTNLEFKYIGNGTGAYGEYGSSCTLVFNCKATSYQGGGRIGFYPYNTDSTFFGCEAQDCDIGFNLTTPGAVAINCYAHSSGTYTNQKGFAIQGGKAINCVGVTPGSGGIGLGSVGSGQFTVMNCVAYNCGSIGIDLAGSGNYVGGVAVNCISVNNTTYGFYAGSEVAGPGGLVNCAAYNNGTNYATGGTATRNRGYITLTADPFTNAAGGDFTLNNAAGGGALLKGVGWPATLPGLIPLNHPSVGAYQYQPASGAATTAYWA